MASRFWVGGTGTVDTTTTTHWSTTSGGAGGASNPTSSDDVFFDANSGGGTATTGAALAWNSVDFTGYTGTFAGTNTLSVHLSFTLSASMAGFTWSGAITFNGTAGTGIITSAGRSFNDGIVFNGVGGTWQLADALTATTTITLTNGTLDLNGKAVQSTTFVNSGTATRVLIATSATWTLTSSGTIWNTNATGFTLTGGSTLVLKATDASATSKTFTLGTGFTYGDIQLLGGGTGAYSISTSGTNTMRDIIASATASTSLGLSGTHSIRNLDCSGGFVGVVAGTGNISFSGNLTFHVGQANATASGVWTANGTGTQVITSNGVHVANQLVSVNTVGALTLADDFFTTTIITVSSGNFNSNGHAITCSSFVDNSSTVRSHTLTGTILTVTGTGTVFNMSTVTNLTWTGGGGFALKITNVSATTKSVVVNGAITLGGDLFLQGSGTGQYTIQGNVTNVPVWGNLFVQNTGGAIVATTALSAVNNIDCTGFNGAFNGTWRILGNCTFVATMTGVGSGTHTYAGTSGTQSLTTAGISIAAAIVVQNPGATFSLADTFTSTSGIILTSGSMTTNSQTVTCGRIILSGSTTRSMTIDNSLITLTTAASVAAWDASTSTNLTLSTTNSEIKLTGIATGLNIIFAGGGQSYHFVTLFGAVAVTSGGYQVSGSSTFDKLEGQGAGGSAQRFFFNDGDTQTIISRFVMQGAATGHFTLGSIFGTPAFLSKSGGVLDEMDYIDLSGGLNVKGGALWFAGRHSTASNDNNQGWFVMESPPKPGCVVNA